jgi:hypothetical protein
MRKIEKIMKNVDPFILKQNKGETKEGLVDA